MTPVGERWAVVGATGFVGRAVAARLASEGVVVLRAPTPRVVAPVDATVETLIDAARVQVDEHARLVDAFRGARVVVIAGGLAVPDAPASPALVGANALAPAVVFRAASAAGVERVVHVSSAAVLGRTRGVHDATPARPFSPYSTSKALGEAALLQLAQTGDFPAPRLSIVRATSVQGPGRSTTARIRRLARSRLSTVAAPGTQASPVSSIDGLVDLVVGVGSCDDPPLLSLQPWEGLSVAEVLEAAGGRPPRVLPRILCQGIVATGATLGALGWSRAAGATRRLDVLWFGQSQRDGAAPTGNGPDAGRLRRILAADDERRGEQ